MPCNGAAIRAKNKNSKLVLQQEPTRKGGISLVQSILMKYIYYNVFFSTSYVVKALGILEMRKLQAVYRKPYIEIKYL